MMKNLCFILSFFTLSITLNAQTFQIRATNKGGGIIGVELRETSGVGTPTTSNFITDLVFGLKWLSTYSISLSSPNGGYNIAKSGVETTQGAYKFQAYQASSTPYNLPANWVTNTWIEIATVANSLNGMQATGVFEICEVGFNVTTNPNIGVDLMDYTPSINGSANNVVLPLELLVFTARKYNRTGILDWQTINETNFDYFDIERSGDGKVFKNIGIVKANGKQEDKKQYNFVDKQPFESVTYYRLKMVDRNERFRYSSIESINWERKITFNVYPNPTNSLLNVDFNILQEENLDIILLDVAGRIIEQLRLPAIKGSNSIIMDINGVQSGFYLLRLQTANNTVVHKVKIQH